MAVVIQLHETKQAKAQGVFAAVNIAARNLGYSDHLALRAAQMAREAYNRGVGSAAAVVSDARAVLRRNADVVSA